MSPTPGRNERCSCGSGRKYKVCCGSGRAPAKPEATSRAIPSMAVTEALRIAHSHIAQRRYADAITPLTHVALLAPNEPDVLHQLGVACLFAQRPSEAVTYLRRSIALEPGAAGPHFELGLALAQAGDEDGALASFLRAAVLDPSRAQAHGQAADILRRKNRMEQAASSYEQAFRAAPGTVYGLFCKGKALAARDRASEAEACLKQVIARAASTGSDSCWHVEAELALGHLLLDEGRFDEAAASFERSIALAPWQTTAHLALVTCKKIAEADRPILARILERIEARELTEGQLMMLHFAAGKALDDLRDYRSAIEHFDAANRIRRRMAPFDRDDFARRVDALIARFTPDFFAENAALGDDDETPVLVLGMPRSGTTLVERFISSHPLVGGGGERGYWNENGPAWVGAATGDLSAQAHRLRGDYIRLLRGIAPTALRVTDKMTFNFLWLGLVHMLLPKARIVHCRRNPLDTCVSILFDLFRPTLGIRERPWGPRRVLPSIPAPDGSLATRPAARPAPRRRLRGRDRRARGDRSAACRVLRANMGSGVSASRPKRRRRADG